MKRILAPVVLALAFAAPAAANTAQATGTVLASGTVGPRGLRGRLESPTTLVRFTDAKAKIHFRASKVDSAVILPYVVKLSGMGTANGKLVHFVAIATHHPSPTGDWFKISWAADRRMAGG